MGLAQEATSLLQRLIRLNTVNPPGNERAAQEMLCASSRRPASSASWSGVEPERPNLIARLAGRSDGPRLCLLGHVDTVLADADGVDASIRGPASFGTDTSGGGARST